MVTSSFKVKCNKNATRYIARENTMINKFNVEQKVISTNLRLRFIEALNEGNVLEIRNYLNFH